MPASSNPHIKSKMPSLNKSILILAAITQAAFVLAAPIPQLAGEGNACSSILSSTDNSIGYGIENAEGTYTSRTASNIRN